MRWLGEENVRRNGIVADLTVDNVLKDLLSKKSYPA
jgi:hypothetical protein